MGVQNPNSTDYVHSDEPNLLNIHKAMQYRNDGTPELRVNSTFEGNIVISGNVNIPGEVTVSSTPENPVHVHLTELGTFGNLTTFMPIQGNVVVSGGNITVQQGTTPWVTTGNANVTVIGNIAGITTLPAITGNVGVSGNVEISRMPAITGNVSITQLPALGNVSITQMPGITGNVKVYGNLSVDNFPSNVRITDMPGITGNVGVVGNVNVTQGTTPWITNISNTTPITVAQSDVAVTAFDEPIAVAITPVIQADVQYGIDPDFWVQTKLNGGNITVTENATWQVSSGTNAGGYARLATSKYMSYQDGQGSLFRWTAAFTATGTDKNALGVDNIVQNTGPIDREDGYSFGYSGSTANDASRKIGILHRRGGKTEIRSLTVTTPPTGAQTATVTLNGTAYTISLTASTSVSYTANQIATALNAITEAKNLWDIEGCNGIITFTSYSPGPRNGTFSFSSTGTGTIAVAAFTRTQTGTTPSDTWTYVDQWDNQDIQFDPTKLNVYQIDMRWLGAGRVRFFMEDPATGKMVLVHTQRWSSQQVYPHVNKPALRVAYRSGTTNPAVTPSQNVIVTGASVMSGIQGVRTQTGSSQGRYNIDSTTRAKDLVWHLMSLQNPYVRNGGVNKASLMMQTLTVAAQGNDPSVIYIVKDAFGLSDVLAYIAIPNTTPAMFAQYSVSAITANLDTQRICNVQTLGINSSATFDLGAYNLTLAAGETVSVFISSSNAINRTAIGLTWLVD
jgi:hypothetical protein